MKLSAPAHRLKRRARLLARDNDIPLHQALNQVARDEGFAAWSLLVSQHGKQPPSASMLSRLTDGDLILLGARPGQGKTLLGLRLLLDAAREGRKATFFTLEYTEEETRKRIQSLHEDARIGASLEIVTSDEIGADYIIRHLADAARGTVAVIDYLQILDQQRSKPALSDQITALSDFARRTGVVLAFISQIDRSFDPATRPLPDLADIRLPNRFDLGLFTKACFLHDGEVRLRDVASPRP